MELTTTTKPSLPEERLLIRELTHRIHNEFTSVVSMMSIAAARTANVEVKSTLAAVMDRLDGYVRVHRALQLPNQGGLTDASAYLGDLCRSISWSKLEQKNIDLIFVDRRILLQPEQCWLLGMIVYELINNASRHAFGEAGGAIRVEIVQSGDLVACHVSDDGTAPNPVKGGRGLKIIKDLAARLEGRFEQKFGQHGSAASVIFPVKQ